MATISEARRRFEQDTALPVWRRATLVNHLWDLPGFAYKIDTRYFRPMRGEGQLVQRSFVTVLLWPEHLTDRVHRRLEADGAEQVGPIVIAECECLLALTPAAIDEWAREQVRLYQTTTQEVQRAA